MTKHYQPDESFKKVEMADIWDFKSEGAGAVFFGEFLYKEENVGPNNSMLYTFTQHKDDKFDSPVGEKVIWGNTILDTRFKNFKPGEQVVVLYLGQEKSEQRKGSSYHNFEVYHRRPPMEKVEEPES